MIQVVDLHKSYNGPEVLCGVNMNVSEGTIFGLIGQNGAGKTTLLNILASVLPYDSGKVQCDATKLGYLPDIPMFFDYMSAGEYIDFLIGYKDSGRRNDLLNRVSIMPKMAIKGMSRGQKQRLGIAAALVKNPQIVLLDEPMSALDPVGREDVMQIMLQLKQEHRTIVFSTHILGDMERICDDYGFLQNGRLLRPNEVSGERNGSWLVIFAKDVNGTDVHIPGYSVVNVSKRSVRLTPEQTNVFEGEKIFAYLCANYRDIVSVTNEDNSLDASFGSLLS